MPSSHNLGYTLGMAALSGDESMVRRLLAAGADLEVQVPVMQDLVIMMTPLHAAVHSDHVRSGTLYIVRKSKKARHVLPMLTVAGRGHSTPGDLAVRYDDCHSCTSTGPRFCGAC